MKGRRDTYTKENVKVVNHSQIKWRIIVKVLLINTDKHRLDKRTDKHMYKRKGKTVNPPYKNKW